MLGFDARGNLTSSGTTTYAYDSLNQLSTAPGVSYLYYEPLGRLDQLMLPSGTSWTNFLWDGSDLVTEYQNNTTSILRRYVHGPGTDEPLVWYEGSGTTDRRWLHTDERGSVVSVSNASGAAIAINRYDEYGIPAATNLGRFQYTGQTWLSELGMYYYKARMYSPTLGRFMQTDPIGYGDGINWYNYVGSDPVNATDPSGQITDDGEIVITGRRGPSPALQAFANASGSGFGSGSGGYSGYRLADDRDHDEEMCREGNANYCHEEQTPIVVTAKPKKKMRVIPGPHGPAYYDLPKPYDACGSGGTSGVPDTLGGADISGPCYSHDNCYGSTTPRATCDATLFFDILSECKRQKALTGCYVGAGVYYVTLRAVGGIAYRAAHKDGKDQ